MSSEPPKTTPGSPAKHNLLKTYSPKETEDKIYKLWEESGFFAPEAHQPRADSPETAPTINNVGALTDSIGAETQNKTRGDKPKRFITCIAPPNITGELHMGHALELTLQDIVVRMKRMRGYKTLWLPGTDHAGIAAQNAVEKQLKKEGESRHDLGREKFIEKMWQWKEKYGGAILDQLKKLGLSLDWSRERFTMDEDYKKAVNEAFMHYYKKGWIYRGERVVNWCIRCATSISDLEVKYEPEKAKLYFIKYGPLILATVRPETRLGDTSLAVHPDDKRYQKYIDKEIEIDTVNNDTESGNPPEVKKIKLPVVADSSVDPEFGGGIIKVTPAHDLTDFEIGQRHNLPSVAVIDEHGRMNKNAGRRYQGLGAKEAREKIVDDMQKLGLLEKTEDYEHNIARCDRCNSVIEPLPSEQWFLKMDKLAKLALKALDDNLMKFRPERWAGQYRRWFENIRDWNISRQLWWGHRLPVWFHEPKCTPRPGREKDVEKCESIKVSADKPECEYCDSGYTQSEDVLDTWFSSALWPFATLHWPDTGHDDFKNHYPTQFITSARDILYLWIARMVSSGMELTGRVPFENIYIHPTILTKDGKRMSKSLGTGINPLGLIDKYGADALRFGLAYQATGLQDMRFNEDVIMMGKKFANKLWNIARYALLRISGNSKFQIPNSKFNANNDRNKAILEKLHSVVDETTQSIERYNFGEAAHLIYDFVWHDFADKYLEETKDKDDEETKNTLVYVLTVCLKLLHPFMPFVTEEIWSRLPIEDKKLLMVEKWPKKLSN